MAKKKVKTNFGEIDKLHKDEVIKLNNGGIAIDIDKVPDWEQILKKWHETPVQILRTEAEWITQIRDYCKANEVFPPHILQFYKEHHTEKAPD
jgi:hypothetical protein